MWNKKTTKVIILPITTYNKLGKVNFLRIMKNPFTALVS